MKAIIVYYQNSVCISNIDIVLNKITIFIKSPEKKNIYFLCRFEELRLFSIIKHLFIGNSHNCKFIVTLDPHHFPRLSPREIEQYICHYPH